MADLVELAERLIRATAEVETVREAMKRLLLNGGGGESPKPNPPRAQRLGGQESQSESRSKSQSRPRSFSQPHPNAAKAAAEEGRILKLLQNQPGLKGAEIARTLTVKPNTASQRLARLSARGAISRGADGAWTASAAPASA
jgi:hypothetical protein